MQHMDSTWTETYRYLVCVDGSLTTDAIPMRTQEALRMLRSQILSCATNNEVAMLLVNNVWVESGQAKKNKTPEMVTKSLNDHRYECECRII